ncbi:MAG: Mut7-C RNAse domain-containing protein [Candidatus Omnitrophota bacterium]
MNHKFILTRELGRLAKWLRIIGYDTFYYQAGNPSTLIISALRQERIILTRNTRIGSHPGLKIIRINSDFVKEQLGQVLKDLNISPDKNLMFSRCIICNEELIKAQKNSIMDKVPEFVYKTNADFVSCPRCKRIYWRGTHWGNVKEIIAKLSNC